MRLLVVLGAIVLLSACTVDRVALKLTFRESPGSSFDLALPPGTPCLAPPTPVAPDRRSC